MLIRWSNMLFSNSYSRMIGATIHVMQPQEGLVASVKFTPWQPILEWVILSTLSTRSLDVKSPYRLSMYNYYGKKLRTDLHSRQPRNTYKPMCEEKKTLRPCRGFGPITTCFWCFINWEPQVLTWSGMRKPMHDITLSIEDLILAYSFRICGRVSMCTNMSKIKKNEHPNSTSPWLSDTITRAHLKKHLGSVVILSPKSRLMIIGLFFHILTGPKEPVHLPINLLHLV